MKSNKDQVPNPPDGKAVTGASGRGFDLEPVAGRGGGRGRERDSSWELMGILVVHTLWLQISLLRKRLLCIFFTKIAGNLIDQE